MIDHGFVGRQVRHRLRWRLGCLPAESVGFSPPSGLAPRSTERRTDSPGSSQGELAPSPERGPTAIVGTEVGSKASVQGW